MTISLLALMIALGGTAIAANTVTSEDIIDGEVKSQDVANEGAGALHTEDVAAGGLTGSDFGASSLSGADVADPTITGAQVQADSIGPAQVAGLRGDDIDESSLGPVGRAHNAGNLDGINSPQIAVARSDAGDSGECTSSLPGAGFEVCADVDVPWPHPGRALVVATGNWHWASNLNSTSAYAVCRIDTPQGVGAQTISVGERGSTKHDEGHEVPFVVQTVTDTLPVIGTDPYDFRLECAEGSSSPGPSDVDDAQISVLALGSG